MKITMEATDQVIEDYGRVWIGETDRGTPVKVLVLAIATVSGADLAALNSELATLKTTGQYRMGIIDPSKLKVVS